MDNKMVDNNVVNTIVNKVKHTRVLAAIGLVAMFLGTLLPYIKYKTFLVTLKLSLWTYWEGKVVLVLIIANAIFLFKDYIEKYIPSLLNIPVWQKVSELKYQYAMAPVCIALVFIIWLTIKLDINFGLYNVGFYTLWFGIICIIVYLIINKGKPVIPERNIVNKDETYSDFPNTTNETNNVNPNYNNGMNNNVNPNYNNGMNNNVNPNYNNGMNNNVNPNYNNGMNNNINPNYNNGMNNNVNPNYNNGMNNNINQNYNNQMNYNPNNTYNNPSPNNFNSNNNQNNM